jgi:hypothetical protein
MGTVSKTGSPLCSVIALSQTKRVEWEKQTSIVVSALLSLSLIFLFVFMSVRLTAIGTETLASLHLVSWGEAGVGSELWEGRLQQWKLLGTRHRPHGEATRLSPLTENGAASNFL